MPVAIMAGLLLHAVAGMLAGGFCSSHFAAVPLLPPSTRRTPWTPRSLCCCRLARVALLCLQGCGHRRGAHCCYVPVGYFVEAFAKNLLAVVGASIQRSEGQEFGYHVHPYETFVWRGHVSTTRQKKKDPKTGAIAPGSNWSRLSYAECCFSIRELKANIFMESGPQDGSLSYWLCTPNAAYMHGRGLRGPPVQGSYSSQLHLEPIVIRRTLYFDTGVEGQHFHGIRTPRREL